MPEPVEARNPVQVALKSKNRRRQAVAEAVIQAVRAALRKMMPNMKKIMARVAEAVSQRVQVALPITMIITKKTTVGAAEAEQNNRAVCTNMLLTRSRWPGLVAGFFRLTVKRDIFW